MTGRPGKWPWKNHSVAVTALEPDDPLGVGVVLDDAVDEQERPAMRDQRLDLTWSCGSWSSLVRVVVSVGAGRQRSWIDAVSSVAGAADRRVRRHGREHRGQAGKTLADRA